MSTRHIFYLLQEKTYHERRCLNSREAQMTSYSRRVIMRVTSAAVIFLFLSLIATIQSVNGARILVLFPVPSYSHQIVYHPILRELSKRGHELVVLTADVFKDENYTQIDFSQGYKAFKAFNFIDQRRKNSWFDAFPGLIDLSYVMAEGIFEHAEMKKLYAPNSNEKFDLVIAEALIWHSTYAFAHRFNAPLIGINLFIFIARENDSIIMFFFLILVFFFFFQFQDSARSVFTVPITTPLEMQFCRLTIQTGNRLTNRVRTYRFSNESRTLLTFTCTCTFGSTSSFQNSRGSLRSILEKYHHSKILIAT